MGYGYARGAGSEEGLGYMELSMPTTAPHIGHRNHLCEIVREGRQSLEQIKALAKDGQFICRKCGRVAISEENLCEPEPMEYTCPACGMAFATRTELMEHAKTHKK